MAEYAVSPEVVRVAIVVGVIMSMLFYERAQLTTGGAIVPAYLSLAVFRPLAIVVTIVIGFLTYQVVTVLLAKRTILYGRRKFEAEVLVGLTLIMVATYLAHLTDHLDPVFLGLTGVGFLVPGIIAHDMARQKPGRTVFAIVVTTSVLAVFVFLITALFDILPGKTADPVQLASVLGYPREFLVVAVALSVLAGMFIFDTTSLRSGGFITGAYLALVSPRTSDLAFTAVVALVTWFIVKKLMMPRLLLFGRRKVSTMILVGAIVGWSAELVIQQFSNGDYTPWRGLTVATLMVPALIANDAERQGWERTVWGTALSGLGVFAAVNVIAAITNVGALT
ncbi:poly-gamma-glutamate biosynthesis protein PgsC/CapC [Luteipulveratus flavus]|uniref:Poly-gamma-glutamate biosynthesis protein PgsC/CapC n=1 Tax=Luteipulveratus flavus TaxID=3031728 RepID=A0ABT6C7N5_9MICO|nr:poly-gamma-glutamate biosynthesis protein PgsC/CapC [Luteipulveratus sp. YIM 133296]MDF8264949.1 poly-gamma-glutamate biosynthesis protein PgsC/CapC [Luteipulveratus sp. YIM 133296]